MTAMLPTERRNLAQPQATNGLASAFSHKGGPGNRGRLTLIFSAVCSVQYSALAFVYTYASCKTTTLTRTARPAKLPRRTHPRQPVSQVTIVLWATTNRQCIWALWRLLLVS
jgi:hypothetical protein